MSRLQSLITERIPVGWRTRPLWTLFRRTKKTGFPQEELLSVYRDYGVIPKSSRDDNFNKESEDLSNYQLVEKGDLVTNKMKTWQGSIAISRYRGIVSPAYYVYTPQSAESDQFLHYLLRSGPYIALYGRISKGVRVNQWDLEHEALRNVPVLLPNFETQNLIAGFLDRETARIDQLIEKKERQVAVLEEEHQAYVTNAVTVGIRRPQLKESGLPWVPAFPEHWTLTRLKFVCARIVDCLHETPEHMETGDFPSIRTADVERGVLLLEQSKRVSEEEYCHRIQRLEPAANDVVYTREGERYGLAALVPHGVKLCLGQRMMMFRANERVIPAFLMWSLNGELAYQWLKQSTAGATSPHLNIFDIRNVPLFLPPKDEQATIASIIGRRLERKESARKTVSVSIDRLREFRSALITAAVTGQIDVGTWLRRGESDRRVDWIEEKMRA